MHIGPICRLNLFDVVLPVTSVLAAFPLTHECAANVPELHALIAHWVDFSLHSMYWLNVLISGRAQGSLWTKHNDTDAITFALTKVALAEPKYGASVKVLFWAAATCALRKLHVTEKNKAVPLVPVRFSTLPGSMIKRLFLFSRTSDLFFTCHMYLY